MEKIRWIFSLPGENNSNHVEFVTKNSQHLLFYKNRSYKYLDDPFICIMTSYFTYQNMSNNLAYNWTIHI
jgi:hypothetical protein